MYPNPPEQPPYQPPTQPPADYLDQIAPQAPQKPRRNQLLKKVIVIGGVLILIVSVLAIALNAFSAAQKEPVERLAVRLSETQTIASEAQPALKSSQLRSLNSDLRLFFTNANRDITTPLANNGIALAKVNSSIAREEAAAAAEMSANLEDARLNAIFDRTYAREMAYQLSTLITLLERVSESTSSQSLRQFSQTALDNLAPIQQGFAEFNDTTS